MKSTKKGGDSRKKALILTDGRVVFRMVSRPETCIILNAFGECFQSNFAFDDYPDREIADVLYKGDVMITEF